MLAAAGLARLGLLAAATEHLDALCPAPGQGALAVECRSTTLTSAPALAAALADLDHAPTRLAVTAERALLLALEAGCTAPVGALGGVRDGRLVLEAVVSGRDGGAELRRTGSLSVVVGADGSLDAARALGVRVADELLAAGAAALAAVGGPR